jgi:hypothetical protein
MVHQDGFRIRAEKTGNISFEVNGIAGASCKDITDLLSYDLEVLSEEDTEEMYATNELYGEVEN